jgi:hypothetical protein
MSTKKWIGTVLLAIGVFALVGVAIWNYTEPETIAYEINPITLEVRAVEYVDRPISGRSSFKVVRRNEMKIGVWLRDQGLLKSAGPGYWTLVKSYNPRWGFSKGPGRAFHSVFDQSGQLSPMPNPSPDSPNEKIVAWCDKYPDRARFVWEKYAELAKEENASALWRAGEMVRWAVSFSDLHDDEQFVSVLRREVLYE